MAVFTPEELEGDILHDLMEEINELYEASEQILIELELTPEDNELQRSLFRSVHTIKGDLGLVGFTPMIKLLQHMEDLLDLLRKSQISYTSNMSDLVLIGMDRVKTFVHDCMHKKQASYDQEANDNVVSVISQINEKNPKQHEQLLAEAVAYLDPNRAKPSTNGASVAQTAPVSRTGIPKDLSNEQQIDLLFLRDLMKAVEKRVGYKEGRGDRLAKLAFFINDIAGKPIPEAQLAVACFVHDFGMASLPLELLKQTTTLDGEQTTLFNSHVYKSAGFLQPLSQWDGAREIVAQHHEYVDGSGYPERLTNDQICDGAKLLAILDKFESFTHPRDYEGKRNLSMKDAVIIINQEYKGRLSGKWLRFFNQAITGILQSH